MKSAINNSRTAGLKLAGAMASILAGAFAGSPAGAVPTQANIAGEIERITLAAMSLGIARRRYVHVHACRYYLYY